MIRNPITLFRRNKKVLINWSDVKTMLYFKRKRYGSNEEKFGYRTHDKQSNCDIVNEVSRSEYGELTSNYTAAD